MGWSFFSKLSPNGILLGFFFPHSAHDEDTKSAEFASVAICSNFFHKMTGLAGLFLCFRYMGLTDRGGGSGSE